MSAVTVEHCSPVHQDDRGTITDLLNTEDAIAHAGLITFTTGAIRANHYHKHAWQFDYILDGSIELFTTPVDDPDAEIERRVVSKGDLITIPANTIHAYRALEPSLMLDFTTQSREENRYEEDTFRVESIVM